MKNYRSKLVGKIDGGHLIVRLEKILHSLYKPLKNISIKYVLIVACLLLTVVPITIIGGVSFSKSNKALEDKYGKMLFQAVRQTAININAKFEGIEVESERFITNKDMIALLSKKYTDDEFDQKYEDIKKLDALFNAVQGANDNIKAMCVAKSIGDLYINSASNVISNYLTSNDQAF